MFKSDIRGGGERKGRKVNREGGAAGWGLRSGGGGKDHILIVLSNGKSHSCIHAPSYPIIFCDVCRSPAWDFQGRGFFIIVKGNGFKVNFRSVGRLFPGDVRSFIPTFLALEHLM